MECMQHASNNNNNNANTNKIMQFRNEIDDAYLCTVHDASDWPCDRHTGLVSNGIALHMFDCLCRTQPAPSIRHIRRLLPYNWKSMDGNETARSVKIEINFIFSIMRSTGQAHEVKCNDVIQIYVCLHSERRTHERKIKIHSLKIWEKNTFAATTTTTPNYLQIENKRENGDATASTSTPTKSKSKG